MPTGKLGTVRDWHDKDTDWMARANCIGADLDLFFPERGESTQEAKAICRSCPVKQECLEFAMEAPLVKLGVWGGTSEFERKALRRQRRKQ